MTHEMHNDADEWEADSRKTSKKTIWIILGIVGGLVIIGCLGCGGVAVYFGKRMFAELPAAQQTADVFLADIAAGRLDEAYARTSQTFRTATSLEQFKKFVGRFPALTQNTSRSYTGFFINQTNDRVQATLPGTLGGPQESLSFTIIVVKEGDEWKIEQFNVP
jgi:hypothetical protein